MHRLPGAVVQANLKKISRSMAMFRQGALANGLKPSETRYLRRVRTGTLDLQFSKSGNPAIEKGDRSHYLVAGAAAEGVPLFDRLIRRRVSSVKTIWCTAGGDTRKFRERNCRIWSSLTSATSNHSLRREDFAASFWSTA